MEQAPENRLPWTDGVFLRLFAPRAEYRAEPFFHSDAIYLSDAKFVAIAAKQHQENQGDIVSELIWLYPEEIRILAALALSVPEGHGSLRFFPSSRIRLPFSLLDDLSSEKSLGMIREASLSLANDSGFESYALVDRKQSSIDFQLDLFESIDPSDDLLIRGLTCLLKAQRLIGDRELAQEAYINVSIAREAALEMIREHLEADGHNNPSFADAHDYLVEKFRAGEHLAEFLLYQHRLWVETKHPKSALGPLWMPQLMADDFYETWEALVSVYRHILTGEPGRESAYL